MKNRAYGLLELMLVLMVIVFLTSIGFPSYRHALQRHRQHIAVSKLQQMANRLEMRFILRHSYQQAGDDEFAAPIHYQWQQRILNRNDYRLVAIPTDQHAYNNCGEISLDSTGHLETGRC